MIQEKCAFNFPYMTTVSGCVHIICVIVGNVTDIVMSI